MAQSYSITAILSAVDRGFSSAMDKAAKSTESLGKTVQDKESPSSLFSSRFQDAFPEQNPDI